MVDVADVIPGRGFVKRAEGARAEKAGVEEFHGRVEVAWVFGVAEVA